MAGYAERWEIWVIVILFILIIIWVYIKITSIDSSKTSSKTSTETDDETKTRDDKKENKVENGLKNKLNEKVNTNIDLVSCRDMVPVYSGPMIISEADANRLDLLETLEKYSGDSLTNTRSLINTGGSSLSSTLTGNKASRYAALSVTQALEELDEIEEPKLPLNIKSDKKVKGQSKGEAECKRVLDEIYGVDFRVQVRNMNALKNPKTKRNLELDLYYPLTELGYSYDLACEYHGQQHYGVVKRFHPNGIESLKYQQWKDNLKIDLCEATGIYLITVPYNVPLDKIKNFITYYLPENVMSRMNGVV